MKVLLVLSILAMAKGSVINRNPFTPQEYIFNRNSLRNGEKFAIQLPDPWPLEKVNPGFRVSVKVPDPNATGQLITVSKDYPYGSYASISSIVVDMVNSGLLAVGRKTTAIVHGFLSDIDSDWMARSASNILLADPTITVILVGWKDGADVWVTEYPQAASNTQTVAKYLAELFVHLSVFNDFVTCTGHSLGAHICGQAGRLKFGVDGILLDYIAGLDPAGPLFETENEEIRLSPNSAKYVENVHTDTYAFGFGTKLALGHADFYPNGEISEQPGCGVDLGCSHSRAHEIYADTIAPNVACVAQWNCSDYLHIPESCKAVDGLLTPMFRSVTPMAKGLFYFKTNKVAPWCPF